VRDEKRGAALGTNTRCVRHVQSVLSHCLSK